MSARKESVSAPDSLLRHAPSLAFAVAILLALTSIPAAAAPSDVIRPGFTQRVCDKQGVCRDVHYPPFPNAGACTGYFRAWHLGDESHPDNVDVCLEFMGVNKYCKERKAFVAVAYVEAPGTWHGIRPILKCSPRYEADSVGQQFVKIWTGIGEGLITAAPFVAQGVLAVTCTYGQIYACAVLALQVSEQAGLEIPGEVEDALYIAAKAPLCAKGDVVACAYLGARGAKLVGLEIPGVAAIDVVADAELCSEGDFAACVRLGKQAADAGGLDTGAFFGAFVDAQTCLDGDDDACFTLAKEAIRDNVPLKGVAGGAESAQACKNQVAQECIRFGKQLASSALGLVAVVAKHAPFGANACTSVANTTGAVDLASVWDDRSATSVAVFPSDGTRFTMPFQASNRNGGWAATAKWAAADFTGDGETDLLGIWDDARNNTLTMRQSAEGGFTVAHWATRAGTWAGTSVWLPGDFDGDGRIDIAGVWKDQEQTSIAVYLSDGTRFKAPVQWSERNGGWVDKAKWAVGDFTGDGKADLAAVWDNGGTNTITVRQSTGSGFVPVHWATNAGGWNDTSAWLAGDFNGDGRLDLAGVWRDDISVSIAVFPSSGGRFPGWSQWSERDGGWVDEARWTSGDFNGDGKTDIAASWNDGGTNAITVRQSTGSRFTVVHWAANAGGWSPSAAWCAGQFPEQFGRSFAESDDRVDSVVATRSPPVVKAQGRVRVDPAAGGAAPATPKLTICESARAAKARNSPAAPGLEQQCLASGGSMAEPVSAEKLSELAAKGGPIAAADPLSAALRAQQTEAGQVGFDIGMAAAENQTAPGPGKQHTHDSLPSDQQPGYQAAVDFSLERNRNKDLAATGAAIALADGDVSLARGADQNVFYQLGFDIATGIFGDPGLGARGNTATGPGSLGIRDALSAAGQRGFNAAVEYHLARSYVH